jgi:hypothetical protein
MPTPLEQANTDLETFENLDYPLETDALDRRVRELRAAFKGVGEPAEPGSAIDQRIVEGVTRLHLLGVAKSFAALDEIKGLSTIQHINNQASRVREHYAALGLPVEQDPGMERKLKARVARALIASARGNLAWLENIDAPVPDSLGDTLGFPGRNAASVREQFAAAGVTIARDSYFDRRIREAQSRAHAVIGVKMLEKLEASARTGEEAGSDSETDFAVGQIRGHFACAGMPIEPETPLAKRIDSAAVDARLMRSVADALSVPGLKKILDMGSSRDPAEGFYGLG